MKAPVTRRTKLLSGSALTLALLGLTINIVAPFEQTLAMLIATGGFIGLAFLLFGGKRPLRNTASSYGNQQEDAELSLLSTLEYGYILCDGSLRILELNAIIGEMLGIHRSDFPKGVALRDAFFKLARAGALRLEEEDLKSLDRQLNDFQTGAPMEFDVRTLHDRWLHIQLFHRPGGDEQGPQGNRILVVVRDISRLKTNESALLKSKSRLKDLAEVASDWFWEMNAELEFSYFSPKATEYMGFDPSIILGKTRESLLSAEERKRPEVQQHLDDLAQRRPFKEFSYQARLPDGTARHISASGIPVFDDQGTFIGYRGAARDITSKLADQAAMLDAKEQLMAQSALFQTILDGLNQGIVTFSQDLKLLTCNQRVVDLFGLPEPLCAPGTPIEELIRFNLENGWRSNIEGLLEDQIEARIHLLQSGEAGTDQFSHPDGRFLEVYRNQLPDGTIILTYTDVSDQLHHELELRKAKEEAEFANHAKSQFLANMSHELRTPLNAIIGFSEIIRDELYGTISHPEYKDFASDIQQSGTHLLAIISDLLDLSKIEAGQKDLNESEMDLGEAAQACIHFVRQKANVKEVSITLDVADGTPLLYADELIVRQIIINLLTNAVTFTRQGSINISVRLRDDGGHRLSIADTGIGMDEHEISIALTPFAQVESYLTRHHEGTGLGLPLVVNLSRLHGGTIDVESEKGVGTTVHVDFPPERTIQENRASSRQVH